jgi:hypothetical protein
MKGASLLVWFGVTTCAVASAAELAPGTSDLPGTAGAVPDAQGGPAEQWQYHEKWDKALQRGLVPSSKGALPGTECRPSAGLDKGTIRPSPMPPGRCQEPPLRVRT